VGKFSFAIELVRKLFCLEKTLVGCSSCTNCRRIRAPFIHHPDIRIIKDLTKPVFLSRHRMIQRYQFEMLGNAPGLSPDIEKKYCQTLVDYKDQGYFSELRSSGQDSHAVDIVFFNQTKLFTTNTPDGSAEDPLNGWLAKKFGYYQNSGGYTKTIKIETIRQLQKDLGYQPYESQHKISIIDDAENMPEAAQNSLLKTLEEPPGSSILFLLTANPSALLPTIRSRCQAVPFHALSLTDFSSVLIKNFGFSESQILRISEYCEGRISKALLLDWNEFNSRLESYDSIFSQPDSLSDDYWAIRTAGIVLGEHSESRSYDSQEMMDSFYNFLHGLLKESISEGFSRKRQLPGQMPLTTNFILELLAGLTQITNMQRFHIDVRLHLESLFMRCIANAASDVA
jgi:DNA polymerase III delta prime subunit